MIGASRLGDGPGVRGRGTVAVLTFAARREGSAAVTFVEPKALGADLEEAAPVAARGLLLEVATEAPGTERPRPERPKEESV
jgi:hypothetical protein